MYNYHRHFLYCFAFFLFTAFSFAQKNSSDPLKPPIDLFNVVEPSVVGLNEDTIAKYLELIRDNRYPDFRGLVVIKDGNLAIEEYFNTYWRETIHDIRSAGKSITEILVGMAIDQGLISDVDQKVCSFFPEFASYKACSDEALTIRHLLTMSSGLDADSDNSNSPGNSGNWIAEDNWVEIAMNLDFVFTPGTRWVYTDVCPMLLGAIIERIPAWYCGILLPNTYLIPCLSVNIIGTPAKVDKQDPWVTFISLRLILLKSVS